MGLYYNLLSFALMNFLSLSSHNLPPCFPLSFRALQCRRLGDDVCDAADRVGSGCVCV